VTITRLAHPVKRELWRLLGGVALCVVLLLGAFLLMDARLDRMRHVQERFHMPALRQSAELSSVLASMTVLPGMSAVAVEDLEDEVAFVASVTRDFGRAQALLRALVALHEREGDPDFERVLARLRRASAELQELARRHHGDPLALARRASLEPVYASVVVQQTQRLHRQASRLLMEEQAATRRLFVLVFVVVSAAVAVVLAMQLRRSLRCIDVILARERDAREGVAAVLAAVPDLWFQLDAKGRFAAVSDPSHPHLDVDWEALRGWDFRPVPAPAGHAMGAHEIWPGRREAWTLEYEVPSDVHGPCAFEARVVPTGRGQWLYLSRDISERKRSERALERSREELERQVALRTRQLTIARDAAEAANRAKSEFLSRMSHELRTPMNAVLGFSQLMGLDPGASASQRQSLDHILRAGKHLLHLINDVLDLAHVESGRLTLSPEPLGVADLAQEAVALMQPQAKAARVRIELEVDAGVVVRGDRLRVKQVLLNLLSNAVKYNRPGGWVRVTARPDVGPRVRIEVADSGQGLSEEGLAKLFEPFVRLGADQDKVEGTGIGLSISRRLVELMDGRIGVDSRAGEGSRFWFELLAGRLAVPPPPQPVGGVDGADAAVAAARVLYVEDNPDNLALAARLVERHPAIRLITAPSAALGFELARAHRPDLVLTDLQLGDASGYVLLERLRGDAVTRAIPAVAITANAMPLEEARAREAGFADFLTKPIDIDRFDDLLRSLLGRA